MNLLHQIGEIISDRSKKASANNRLHKFGKGYELPLDLANEISQAVSNYLQQVRQ